MHDDAAKVLRRLARYRAQRIEPALYSERRALELVAWEVAGEPVPFDLAAAAPYTPFQVGQAYGAPWSTTWFRATGTVPVEWTTNNRFVPELVIDLGFGPNSDAGFQCEGTVYDPQGRIIKAIENLNRYVPVTAEPGAAVEVFIEAASNPDVLKRDWISPTLLGDKATAGSAPIYALRAADLALRDTVVWELLRDLDVLEDLLAFVPDHLPRHGDIIRAFASALDALDFDDVAGTAAAVRDALAPALASPAYSSAHRVYAVGHAHIDSAWLWPTRETIRKCARTFSNVLHLMDIDPDFRFACSSAQQYQWVKRDYPELFERIKQRVAEGRFVPVGGMWVESDTNMVGGEAMVRQFLEGHAFFRREFGWEPDEVWLPDSFGYSGALPQIFAGVGATSFLTQKISWNDTNRMPHHSFDWRGIDGTTIFTHFPPVDSYNASLSAAELARAERNFREKGHAHISMVPFGHGDGGGGPTREMLATAHRTEDLEGSPRVHLASPVEFFRDAKTDYPVRPVWDGELYLEIHRGVYTSQHRTKAGNRRSEQLLRAAELWATTATVRRGLPYPADELRELWQIVLLQQFHDILPGTSIAWVHREAEKNYDLVAEKLRAIIRRSVEAVAGVGDAELLANASPFPTSSIPAGGIGVPTLGRDEVTITREGDGILLESPLIRLEIDAAGHIVSLVDRRIGREVVPDGHQLGALLIRRDIPSEWEAWDIDAHDKASERIIDDVQSMDARTTALGAEVVVVRRDGASSFTQRISLDADAARVDFVTEVDWRQHQRLLKLHLPLRVHATVASSEIQFGHIQRSLHANTSWDAARFETVAHRWLHVGEPGFGIAVANDSTYGHDITTTSTGDGRVTVVNETLLRAPVAPDPEADQGSHVLRTSLSIGAEIPRAVAEGYRLNSEVSAIRGAGAVRPLTAVEGGSVAIEAVKLAEDGSGDVIIRCYEYAGSRGTSRLRFDLPCARVARCSLLERDDEPIEAAPDPDGEGTTVELSVRPFEIVTLRLFRSSVDPA
jgi:alpha-mannosidase